MTRVHIHLPGEKFSSISKSYERYLLGGASLVIGLFFLLSLIFSSHDAMLFGSIGSETRREFNLLFGNIVAILLPLLIITWAIRVLVLKNFGHQYVKLLAILVFAVTLCALLTLPLYRHPEAARRSLLLGGLVGNFITSDSGLRLPRLIGIAGCALFLSALMIPSLLLTTDFLFYRQIRTLQGWLGLRLWRTKDDKIPKSRMTETEALQEPIIRRASSSHTVTSEAKTASLEKSPPPEIITKTPSPAPQPKEKRTHIGYKFPPLSLLHDPPPVEEEISEEEIRENCQILEKTLADFSIEVKVVQVTQGPVVTLYAMKPAPGVKVNSIVSLENDIAMALRAVKVRIQAPIPGKDTVGIEVPNRKEQSVFLKEILTCEKMSKARSPLAFCLGKTISGEPFIGDLSKMPHLLLAGATGSGKSVSLNSLIASILYRQPPERVKFMLIDPKRVEMSVYQAIPHLISPVVYEPKKCAAALGWAVEHMEDRYRILAEAGVRNIDSYNALALSDKPNKKLMGREFHYMPHIVIVIDELADLMMIARNDVEDFVIRLAQLSRAVGIHLVIATQRPSVNVITGIIKANFPCRIAFQVSSKVDSRTIIDMNGAETLLGRGDMLFSHAGAPKPIRIQGAFISEDEVESLADFIREQEKAAYLKEDFEVIEKSKKEIEPGAAEEEETPIEDASDEELYQRALRMVLETRKPSVSMIQRRIKIGYARAGRLMDMMEDAGIVGPYHGSKPRDLLIDPDEELARMGLSPAERPQYDEEDSEEELDDGENEQ
jgi:S-DNA-T family DNA segregation ATPase FtsK/SpoIIIE